MGNEEIDLEEQVQNKKCGCSQKRTIQGRGKKIDQPPEPDRRAGARDQENAGTGRVLYGYFDPGFRGERGIEQLQQRIAGRTYPHLCGRRHPAGKR